MLQLSNWARLQVKAPSALVCTSCRHLLHNAASTSLLASPSPARAFTTSSSTSKAPVKAETARNKLRKNMKEVQKRPRRKSQTRGAKSTESTGETPDGPTNNLSEGLSCMKEPVQADVESGQVDNLMEDSKAAAETEAERRMKKRLKRARLRAKKKAEKEAAEADATGGGAPAETTDSTPKPSLYNPAQLSGAMQVLKNVLNKELYNERKSREATPKPSKTKKPKKSKAEKAAAEEKPMSKKAKLSAADLPKEVEEKPKKGKVVTKLAAAKSAKPPTIRRVVSKLAAAKPAKSAKPPTIRRYLSKEVPESQVIALAKAKAEKAEAEKRALAKKFETTTALGRSPAKVVDYLLNNAKSWDESQSLPYEKPSPKVPQQKTPQVQPKRTGGGVAHRLFQTIIPKRVSAENLDLVAVEKAQPPVPKLSYGLDRVLFNPGVYHLQDPRTRVFNFDPYLARIMPIKEFDFGALKQYITSSKDTTLIDMAAEHKRKYTGSTSSMTAMLAHFHFLLSAWRPINPLYQSAHFELENKNFSQMLRAPAAAFLHYKDGVYAIDADKEFDTANILSMLGKSMEKLLTLPKEEFEKYRRTKSDQLSDEEKNGPEAYHYTTLGDFMMRSQLDAFDPRIPGTGMFDLKTRAVASIRFGIRDIKKGLGYEIRDRVGQWESYEREYHDMIRSAFIKYSLQVRMGRMDGIFVAFHNTQRIFGFQYISLSEMDHTIHGTPNPHLGDREFKLSLHLLNKLLDKATKKFPKRSLRLHFETRQSDPPFMYAFAEPVTPEAIEKVQGMNQKAVEEFENAMMGARDEVKEEEGVESAPLEVDEEEVDVEGEAYDCGETNMGTWEDMMDKVEEVLQDEEQGVTAVRESIESALKQSGLLHTRSSEEARRYLDALLEALTSSEEGSAAEPDSGVLDADADLDPVEESVSDTVEAETALEMTDETSTEVATTDSTTSPDSENQVPTTETEVEDESTEVQQSQDGDVTEESGDASASYDEPSLKDLILRLASQVKPEPQQQEQYEEEDVTEDTLKLRKFESILSELIAKNREINHPAVQAHDEHTTSTTETVKDSLTEGPVPGETETSTPLPEREPETEEEKDPQELLGMIMTVRNKINNEYVDRPHGMHPQARWDVEYVIEEIKDERAQTLYKMLKKRRRNINSNWKEEKKVYGGFREKLAMYSKRGKTFRSQETQRNRGQPVHVYGMDEPLEWTSVFGEAGEKKLPDGMGYKEWKSEEEPGARWEDTETRNYWARDLNMRPLHVPQFEITSSYHADNPAKVMEAQMKAAKQEARQEEQRMKSRAAAEAKKMAAEAAEGAGMMGLNLSEIDGEGEGDGEKGKKGEKE